MLQKKWMEPRMEEFVLPISFLCSMSLLGLEFPFAYLLVFLVLFFSWKINRYDFLWQCTILFGIYGFYDENITFPFKLSDLLFIVYAIGILIYRKNKVINLILKLSFIYISFLLLALLLSEEELMIQVRRFRTYLHFLYFLFPVLLFRKQVFSMDAFFRKAMVYLCVISCFYIIDSLVLCSHVLMPRTMWGDLTYLTLETNLMGDFLRIYPPGMYLVAILLFPMFFIYRFPFKYYLLMALGLLCTKTFSIIGGVLITIFCFCGTWKKKLVYLCVGFSFLYVGYIVDGKMNGALRIQHLVGQFTSFKSYHSMEDALGDMENLADFASGRGAQIIPKLELLSSTQKMLFGFGFLHDNLTTNEDYIINNTYYSNQEYAQEVATAVEVTQIQAILDIGIIGLIVQHAFFIYIYLVIRRMSCSKLYLSVLICISIFGIGGFAGLTQMHGLLLLGLSLGTVLLRQDKYIKVMAS